MFMAKTARSKGVKPAPKKPLLQGEGRSLRRIAHSEKMMEPEAIVLCKRYSEAVLPFGGLFRCGHEVLINGGGGLAAQVNGVDN